MIPLNGAKNNKNIVIIMCFIESFLKKKEMIARFFDKLDDLIRRKQLFISNW